LKSAIYLQLQWIDHGLGLLGNTAFLYSESPSVLQIIKTVNNSILLVVFRCTFHSLTTLTRLYIINYTQKVIEKLTVSWFIFFKFFFRFFFLRIFFPYSNWSTQLTGLEATGPFQRPTICTATCCNQLASTLPLRNRYKGRMGW
jgi:hypothetical protein